MTDPLPTPSDPTPDVDAIVVGAGLGGLCAIHQLRSRGLSVRAFEVGGNVGGTWFWNCYPGARCDVESIDYSFGFDEQLQQEWTWTERYAAQPEILRYVEHVADRLALREAITFDTRVVSAVFDEASLTWLVTTDGGEAVRARICVMATGNLSTTNVPDYPGIDGFAGELIHPGRWPRDREVDWHGKRVGVLGTGSTGIQLVTALAADVERLVVFQRTANYSMPAHNHPLDAPTMDAIKATYPERRAEARRTRRGFPLPATVTTESIFAFEPAEQQERLERGWDNGGAIFTATFGDLATDAEANAIASEFVRDKIRAIVDDPAVAERLAPHDHPLGGKRPCVDSGYFETFNRDNVELVDLKETPIVEFLPHGVRTTAGEHDLDLVIVATGYDAITGTLNAIDVRGRDGATLKDHWADGATAYLGLCCAGFPNLFVLTGPGSPSILCNVAVSIEQHVELMLAVLDEALRRAPLAVEVDAAAEERWAEHVTTIAAGTLVGQSRSWYSGSNIPGKPSRFVPYAAGMVEFEAECAEILGRDFEGFRFAADVAATVET
ncbi:MAG TPA: NAD(P)/FAD-dependent oxidoreductase [Baekduia sp.]|uniref:flavin-containing monooxygenase n=1 Tax=Baekduia sp. TaxID=2600305 RepID=UPI002D77167D|nr:NAD(P)/FAD-dependent oxidoreductase [Baekduia sp.]HET6509078.1 NAD(P)/FAD-dependent oxidoreductase [Baekduia sp.]